MSDQPNEVDNETFEYIRATPVLLTLLYDLDLMPEHTDAVADRRTMLRIVRAWREEKQ